MRGKIWSQRWSNGSPVWSAGDNPNPTGPKLPHFISDSKNLLPTINRGAPLTKSESPDQLLWLISRRNTIITSAIWGGTRKLQSSCCCDVSISPNPRNLTFENWLDLMLHPHAHSLLLLSVWQKALSVFPSYVTENRLDSDKNCTHCVKSD